MSRYKERVAGYGRLRGGSMPGKILTVYGQTIRLTGHTGQDGTGTSAPPLTLNLTRITSMLRPIVLCWTS